MEIVVSFRPNAQSGTEGYGKVRAPSKMLVLVSVVSPTGLKGIENLQTHMHRMTFGGGVYYMLTLVSVLLALC